MRSLAFSYVYIQAAVILGITITLAILDYTKIALPFLWGGMTCLIPNAYFAHRLFANTGAQAVGKIMKSFYLGEIVKIFITIVLFAIAFKLFKTGKIGIFIGYIIAQVTFWFAALLRHRTVNHHG